MPQADKILHGTIVLLNAYQCTKFQLMLNVHSKPTKVAQ